MLSLGAAWLETVDLGCGDLWGVCEVSQRIWVNGGAHYQLQILLTSIDHYQHQPLTTSGSKCFVIQQQLGDSSGVQRDVSL